jgi:hypothetical protein
MTVDLETLLADADPARQVPPAEADSAEAARLYRRITAVPHGRPWHARTVVRVPIALAAVAGLAAAIAVTSLPRSAGPAPLPPSAGHASLPPSQGPAPRAHGGQAQVKAASALEAVAATAAGRPAGPVPGPGQYFYVKDTEVKLIPRLPRACSTIVRQEWLASDGSGRQVGTSPGCPRLDFRQSWPKGGNGVQFNYLAWRGLPTRPAALERAIVRRFEGGHRNNAVTFLDASSILNLGAPPAMRAALYRMIARLPGIEYLGPMKDPLGRDGIGVALTQPPPLGSVMTIFDPATSLVLAQGDGVARSRGGMSAKFEPVTYVTSGIVNSITATPPAVRGQPSSVG